jgi:hypothetical protein
MRRFLKLVACLFAMASIAAAPPALPQMVEGVDHIPLAVNNLDQAVADFQRLGFVLKPGRPHTDGIRNAHVKFRDGTEIELITASSPTDALARGYVDWLKGGDGPAFWGLFNPDLVGLTARLSHLGLAPTNDGDLVSFPQTAFPHRLFFADRLWSPTDRPEHFAHPNTAYHLEGVWLAGAEAERRLVLTLGAVREALPACSPFSSNAEALLLPEGDEVMFMPAEDDRAPGRSIVGATILVRNIDTVARVLDEGHVSYLKTTGCGHSSLWVRPKDAHNMWLEFRR